ncbi:hypothetical protein A8B73_06465 [Methylosinus sp. 3S-1]|nr:hypothetical protein A8B73_06465 [Methylosinus sp. 3S-1]
MWTRIRALIVKELLAAFRDPRARVALVVPPVIQLFLFAYAATLEVTNQPIGVLDQDWGAASRQLVARFERASAFSTIHHYASLSEAQSALDRQDVMVVTHIPQDFSRKLASGDETTVQTLLDGRKSNSAQLVSNYVATIVQRFGEEYRRGAAASPPASELVDRSWYNPNRDYRMSMVPSLVATLTMSTVLMIVGMSVARERELGTFEQLLVSPLQPHEIVVGKAAPGLIIGLGQGALTTLIVTQIFGVPLSGSIAALFLGLFVFLAAMIGVGLFISSLAGNQQQAMMGAMVYLMPAMLLSGFTSPVHNMPNWLQPLALVNPLTHFLIIVRGAFLREASFWSALEHIWPIAAFAAVTLAMASWLFRRQTQ